MIPVNHGRIRYYAPNPAGRVTLPANDPFAFMDQPVAPARTGPSQSLTLVRCSTAWCGEWIQANSAACKTCGTAARPRN